jgi:hypothetical protein
MRDVVTTLPLAALGIGYRKIEGLKLRGSSVVDTYSARAVVMGKLANKEPVSDIAFDELSSAAWLAIDGQRSILDIARIQSEKTGDDIDESARRIVQFMRYIAKKG